MLEFEQHIRGLQHPNGPAKVCIMVFVYPNPQFYLWQCANSICIRYIQYTTYAEKHMALSQLFSREKPKQKSHGFKSRFPHENGRFTVSPSGKSPSFTQVSPGRRLGSFQFLHHACDHLLTCPQDGSWGSHLSIIHMGTMVLEYESKHLPHKSPSFVGKFYTSTMEHLGNEW